MRAEIRRGLRCSCDGRSHRSVGRSLSRSGQALAGELDAIASVTGQRPYECAGRAYYSPDVVAVLHAYDEWSSSGRLNTLGRDPPHWIVLGVQTYHRAIERVRADTFKKTLPKSKGPRPPPGFVVEHEGGG